MRAIVQATSLAKTTVWVIALGLALAGVLAGVLFLFDPSRSAFYPVCYFHQFTGWLCPGCGSLRALHHLTHGELATAFRCNPLLVLALPALAWFSGRRLLRGPKPPAPLPNALTSAAPWVLVATIVLFGILRNLPYPAFNWMAP